MSKKTMIAEFYAMHVFNEKDFNLLFDLLNNFKNKHAPSISLEKKDNGEEADEKYQIRSISSNKKGDVFKAVFGRCRYNENLEQASENSDDKEVELLPGHGLVEKNHFLFFKENNLIVYQKNGNGSGIAKLQRYLILVAKKNIALEAVLKEDSYTKLMNSGPIKKLELSILPPPFLEVEEEHSLYEAIKLFKSDNAKRVKIILTAEKGGSISDDYRKPMVDLTRAGLTKVARAVVEKEEIDGNSSIRDEIIDLIMNRVKASFTVEVEDGKRADPRLIWQGLAGAKDECNSQLKAYFTKD